MNRPYYVHCVLTGRVDEPRLTWCGRTVQPATEWLFADPTHAILNGRAMGSPEACPACAAAMVSALKRGTWDGEPEDVEDEAETPTTDAPSLGIDAGSGGMSPDLSLGHRSAGGPSVEEDASRGCARVPGGRP